MTGGAAFVYGTLMAPEVVKALIKRVPTMKPATLQGFTRYRVKGVVFPAITPDSAAGAKVRGQVLMDLTEKEMAVLDAYESIEYYRQTVEPCLEDGSVMTADVYVWKDEYKDSLESATWNYEKFLAENLADYLVSTVEEFMKKISADEDPTLK